MTHLTIITNNIPREIFTGYDVPEQFHSDFDYMDDIADNYFFKYKGQFYALDQFMRIPGNQNIDSEYNNYHGVHNEGYFSGILIKLDDSGELVTVARYYS